MKKNVAVVMGGYSLEYNISLNSGAYVMRTIDDKLYNIFKIIRWKNLIIISLSQIFIKFFFIVVF